MRVNLYRVYKADYLSSSLFILILIFLAASSFAVIQYGFNSYALSFLIMGIFISIIFIWRLFSLANLISLNYNNRVYALIESIGKDTKFYYLNLSYFINNKVYKKRLILRKSRYLKNIIFNTKEIEIIFNSINYAQIFLVKLIEK